MIPNITKGGDMRGVVRYLVGPGRANEHTNQHVIGGDDFLQAWYGSQVLNEAAAAEIAAYLDEPRMMFGTKVQARVTEQDPATGEKRITGYKDQHVWHCSLSVAAQDGPLSDEAWQQITSEFMDEMGFTQASGKTPARWVAIHHGASKNGNDHVHIVASMVREDGTRWEGRYKDFPAAQQACRQIEVRHGLAGVAGPGLGLKERGERPVEQARRDRAGQVLTGPQELAGRLRAAAVASSSEAEWVRRVRAAGVVVKPRYAAGTTDVVAGYRAALKTTPGAGDKIVFYGGGTLGKDLSLPRLRELWPEPSLDAAAAAVGEWDAAYRGQPPVAAGPERQQLAQSASTVAASNYQTFNDQLVVTPYGSRDQWADAARDASAVLSAWAQADPTHAAELQQASKVMARSAQYDRSAAGSGRRVRASAMGTAFVLMSARPGTSTTVVAGMLMRQILTTAKAVAAHHRALGDLKQAQAIQAQVVDRLQVMESLGQVTFTGAEQVQARDKVRQAWQTSDEAHNGPTPSPMPRPLARRQQERDRATQVDREGRE